MNKNECSIKIKMTCSRKKMSRSLIIETSKKNYLFELLYPN